MESYGYIAILLAAALLLPIGGLAQSWVFQKVGLRPNHPGAVKEETYECGVPTIGSSWIQFNFRYYYYALLFVIFDVEAVFMLPWALKYRQMVQVGSLGLVEMAVFILILMVGFVYAWRKRALEWA